MRLTIGAAADIGLDRPCPRVDAAEGSGDSALPIGAIVEIIAA
jgi:hypothetical protein